MRVYDLGNTAWLEVTIVGSDLTNVNTVAGSISNVNTVAGSISGVNAVANNATNINAVNSNSSNINTVAGAASNVNAVASNESNVNTVASNISNVNAIATDIAKIQTVANDLNETVSEIETAANDLNETTSEIDTVANAITNVDNVGNNIANVNTVAGISANVTTVAGNNANVTTVAGAITNVNNVGGSIANVNTVATNISSVNDFADRYRVGANNPTDSLTDGDLFWNTNLDKLLVYNATAGAWEETQTIGSFFINTISSFSGTGGNSATFNGSAYKFTLSNAGAFAQQMIVSINGVVQKPNSGTGQPSEGFALDGANIVFAAAPPSGADYFIITIGASVSIGTPSDETVTLAKFVHGTSGNNGKFLRANNGADPTWETVSTTPEGTAILSTGESGGSKYLREDGDGTCSWQSVPAGVGGANGVDFNDGVKARFGTGNDMEIVGNANNSGSISNAAGSIGISVGASPYQVTLSGWNTSGTPANNLTVVANSGANTYADLRYDGNVKLATNNTGITVTGTVAATAYTGDGSALTGVAATSADGTMYKNSLTISNNTTIAATEGAHSVGPITNNATVTVNGRWVIS